MLPQHSYRKCKFQNQYHLTRSNTCKIRVKTIVYKNKDAHAHKKLNLVKEPLFEYHC